MKIRFTSHANQKIRILARHGVKITKRLVEDALNDPERVVLGLGGRRGLDENHIPRAVFIRQGEQISAVTLYPARRGRY